MTEQEIRHALGEVLDRLQELPADAFSERAELRDRQAELSRMLREIHIPGSDDIKERWSKAAGTKPSVQEKTKPVIVSPIEPGGGVC